MTDDSAQSPPPAVPPAPDAAPATSQPDTASAVTAAPRRRPGTRGAVNPVRLLTVEALLMEGRDNATIQHGCAKEWQCTERTVRTYIKRVKDRWTRDTDGPGKLHDKGVIRACLWSVYNKAMTRTVPVKGLSTPIPDPDLKQALVALRNLADLQGYRVTNLQLSGPNGQPLEVSPAAAVEQLARALDRAATGRPPGAAGAPTG